MFSEIKNIDFEDKLICITVVYDTDFKNILEIKNDILRITEIAGATTAALGGGALAGLGAFGGAGLLASASTGTAISALSGVAATNATLAWFGSSLAAGGLGMAGGMAVLGGIVAGPILAIAGGIFAAKAETAKYESYANLTKARACAEEMKVAQVIVEEIEERLNEFINILTSLSIIFEKEQLDMLEDLVIKNKDYSTYSEKRATNSNGSSESCFYN